MEQAASAGNRAAIEKILPSLLLSYDATVPLNERTVPGANPVIERSIRLAVQNQRVDVIRLFLEKGTDVSDALICSVLNSGSVELCQLLLEHGWDVNRSYITSTGDWRFWTPLRAALGYPAVCRWLLEHGADPNLVEYGFTPIMVAARLHSPEVVKLLIQHGADPRTKLLLHATANASSPEMAAANPDRRDQDRIEVLRILLQNGADVNEMEPDPKSRPRDDARRKRTIDTGTPLNYAIAAGNSKVVSFLLANGADPRLPTWSGHTPLQAAEILEKDVIAEILRRYER